MSPAHGFKTTRQRQVILEEIRKVHTHPTAAELYEMVRHRLPRVSLGTVYRNLELLSEWGVIQKLEWAGTQKRFDGNPEEHCHMRCLGCGRVEDLPLQLTPILESEIRRATDYQLIGHRLEFTGLCPQCKPPTEASAAPN